MPPSLLPMLFCVLLMIEVVLLLLFTKRSAEIIVYARRNDLPIFDAVYSTVFDLYLDIGFLHELLSGREIHLQDDPLREKLRLLRWLLRIQLGLALGILLVGIVSGAQASMEGPHVLGGRITGT